MRADVFAPRSLTPTTGTGSATDANDGSFKVTFKSSGVVQTYSLNSTSTILTVATDGSFSRGSTFNRIKGTCT